MLHEPPLIISLNVYPTAFGVQGITNNFLQYMLYNGTTNYNPQHMLYKALLITANNMLALLITAHNVCCMRHY